MKAATCDMGEIGQRLRVAREALGLTQEALAVAVGGSKRGIQDNEARKRVPGGEIICGLVRLGINANWLLAGEGPMLLADMKPALPVINVDALSAIIMGFTKAGLKPEKLGEAAVRFYLSSIEQGLITPTGIGEGGAKAA